VKRSIFLASLGLAGCGYHLGNRLNDTTWIHNALGIVQPLNHDLIGTRGMARLYKESDIDRNFRVNGFDPPNTSEYVSWTHDGYRGFRLIVGGMVDRPRAYTLSELRAFPGVAQITRHDCVEGWSAIGKWTGPRLGDVLAAAAPRAGARYVVFHCMDMTNDGSLYYESLGLHEAAHPQTLLALRLNDKPLDAEHGAPVRLRVPTQLGYKSAKWVRRIEVVASLSPIGHGYGGYWEDNGYEWYAGI
jgi:DMSO/TMAO reductase YedYZ molybdopterin-dependent catalytic subunit